MSGENAQFQMTKDQRKLNFQMAKVRTWHRGLARRSNRALVHWGKPLKTAGSLLPRQATGLEAAAPG